MSTKTLVIRPPIFAGLGLALAFLLFSEPARAANVCTVGSNDQVNIFGAYKFTNLTSTSAGVNSKISDPDSKTAKPEGPYLSKADLESVMKWIAVQVGAKIPYCYKQSSPRGAGVPLSTCPEGTEKNGLLCYPQCREGFTGNGPVCWQTECPEGFNDIGAFCQKPAAYGDADTRYGTNKMHNENEQGCEKWALWYPKCRDGFKPFGKYLQSELSGGLLRHRHRVCKAVLRPRSRAADGVPRRPRKRRGPLLSTLFGKPDRRGAGLLGQVSEPRACLLRSRLCCRPENVRKHNDIPGVKCRASLPFPREHGRGGGCCEEFGQNGEHRRRTG